MNKPWFLINLEEAKFALERAIEEVTQLEPEDDHVAQQLVSETYIKLNYAWNSRDMGADSTVGSNYDEWIKYPKEMDMYTG